MMKKNLKKFLNHTKKSKRNRKRNQRKHKTWHEIHKEYRKENNQGKIEYIRRETAGLQYLQSHKHHTAAQVPMYEG